MRVIGLRWSPFRLPFVAEFATAGAPDGVAAVREGLILRIHTDAGVDGLGEASPLPERGEGDAAHAEGIVRSLAPTLLGLDLAAARRAVAEVPQGPGRAAVSCALDVALLDAEARAAGVSAAQGLMGSPAATAVPVNATVGAVRPVDVHAAASAARNAGYRAVKLKVGMERDAAATRDRVAAARDALGPHVALRLDANGAWSVEQAVSVIRSLEPYDLEWVEQPVAAADLRGLRAVRGQVAVPIAADESLTDRESVQRVLDTRAVQVLVLKPMSLGGLQPAREIALLAAEAGLRTVVTTTIDSGVATAAALHLAASLPGEIPPCGLATAGLLASDLLGRPLRIECGRMLVPTEPGLGVRLDPRALDLFRTAGDRTLGSVRP